MKGLRGVIIMMLTACIIQACNGHKPQNYNNTLAVDTDGDTTPDTSVKLNMVVDQHDRDFAIVAINSGITEIALGRLAIKNGKSKEVKNFGQMMLKDHSKADHQLLMLLEAKNIAAPQTPDGQAQAQIKDMGNKSGADFDKAYIAYMQNSHAGDVKFYTDEAKTLQDPDLKNFATKRLPILKDHLEQINAIHTVVK